MKKGGSKNEKKDPPLYYEYTKRIDGLPQFLVIMMTTRRMSVTYYFYVFFYSLWFSTTIIPATSAMHRTDTSNYFLFIEPDASQKSAQPVQDELTASVQAAFDSSTMGTSRYNDLDDVPGTFRPKAGTYRGFHIAQDGAISDTSDYLLPNGFITNSLCVHYVQYYRQSLPTTELTKLQALHDFMMQTEKTPPPKKDDNTEL